MTRFTDSPYERMMTRRPEGPLQNDPKKRARFGARKGFQTSLVAIFLVCEDKE